jgi:hypothetical protein
MTSMVNLQKLLILVSLIGAASLQPATAQQLTPEQEEWGRKMADVPPPGLGCYFAEYPNFTWTNRGCRSFGPPPLVEAKPQMMQKDASKIVGKGSDYSISTPAPISLTGGSFPFATGNPNTWAYTLQLNTDIVDATCSVDTPLQEPCKFALQFVYQQTSNMVGDGGILFMQYWILDVSGCPEGWYIFGPSCYKNSGYSSISNMDILNFGAVKLYGYTARRISDKNGNQIAVNGSLMQRRNTMYAVIDRQEGFEMPDWRRAEFGVFSAQTNGVLNFIDGTLLEVKLEASYDNYKTASPDCITAGTTGEANNLKLGPCKIVPYDPSNAESYPYITFIEWLGQVKQAPSIQKPRGEYLPDVAIPVTGTGQPGAVIRASLDGKPVCYTRVKTNLLEDWGHWSCPDLKGLPPGKHAFSVTQGYPDLPEFPDGLPSPPAQSEFMVLSK